MLRFVLTIFMMIPVLAMAQDRVVFSFTACCKPLELNKMQYTSKRGLMYQVSQVQYFVSSIKVHYLNGSEKSYPEAVHYVDAEIPNTLTWQPSPDFSLKNADTLIFTFGLDSLRNRSYRFRNPPENMMFWPDYLGGGYHYMKTNILYKAPDGNISAFNCHIGRGQVYNAQKEPIAYIENSMEIRIPVRRDAQGNAIINLDISTIFDYPNAALFTDYRGIMNNQEAMSFFCRNIREAFGRR